MPVGKSKELPATLAWYRDAANWVVGLSTGAIAAGLMFHEEIHTGGGVAKILFGVSGLLFVIAIICGVQFYFWITSYANQREARDELTAELAKTPSDTNKQADRLKLDESMDRAEVRFGNFYIGLLWAFHLGALGFVILAAALLYDDATVEPAKTWSVVIVSGVKGHMAADRVLKVDPVNGETFELTVANTTGEHAWKRIVSPEKVVH